MSEMQDTKHKMEILKMARELLNEEYINRRAQDHNRWVAESDVAWRTRRMKLPYPPFASYPTEEEIVNKAAALYKFIHTKPAVSEESVAPELTPAEQKAAEGIKVPIMEPEKESPWVTYLKPVEEPQAAPTIEAVKKDEPVEEVLPSETKVMDQPQPAVQSFLPGWVRRRAE